MNAKYASKPNFNPNEPNSQFVWRSQSSLSAAKDPFFSGLLGVLPKSVFFTYYLYSAILGLYFGFIVIMFIEWSSNP